MKSIVHYNNKNYTTTFNKVDIDLMQFNEKRGMPIPKIALFDNNKNIKVKPSQIKLSSVTAL